MNQLTDSVESVRVESEKGYQFAPSDAFTQETLEDIRNRLGLRVSSITFKQFVRILDTLMTVCFKLAVATDGFRYVNWADDDVLAKHNCSGKTYVLKLDKFAPSVKGIIADHIAGGGNDLDAFVRYRKTIEEFCDGDKWEHDFVLGPIEYWEGNLPTRKQVLDLYRKLYVLPAEEEDK